MPMYQTKTIAGILEPVAQQVSKLIILHEEGEDGNAMPNLERPVHAVSKAVENLVRVGKDTINSSQDSRLKSEMPRSLNSIERAADLLEKACTELKSDPFSQNGRDHLIAGSRGILQGTTSMLVSFDESQVRRLCRDAKKVLDYLAVSEVIETMEDLVQFVKDLSPCLSKVCQDVDGRRKDLLNPYQRDALGKHLDQVKTLAPILICSMKIFIQILSQQESKLGTEEAIENRNYLAKRMTEEVGEIQRILEETAKEDSSGSGAKANAGGANGFTGFNTNEMTFHEILKRVTSSLSSQKKDHTLNQKTLHHIVELGYKIADGFDAQTKKDILSAANDVDRINRTHGQNLSSPQAKQQLLDAVTRLEGVINEAVLNRIITDMADITTPLKLFTDAVMSREPLAAKRDSVEARAHGLKIFSAKLAKTSSVVAFANARNKRREDNLHHLSSQIQTLTPQLINAGTIRMNYPENKAAEENFENLRKQYAAGVQNIRDLCDESIDLKVFLQMTEAHIRQSVKQGEDAIHSQNSNGVIESTALTARLSNRLLMALNKESENSDDPSLKRQVNVVSDRLKAAIAPFVEKSKYSAQHPGDATASNAWKTTAERLLEVVSQVTKLFDELNMYGFDSARNGNNNANGNNIPIMVTPPTQSMPRPPQQPMRQEAAPPRPPLPEEVRMPGRPPLPDTDDEEGLFSSEPGMNRPIHQAAHGLYQEVRQWDHTDNEIIAAAKKIAYLMAHLSELVRPGRGTKRELIACSKGLAEVSERITELAKELAKHCTDKKIRTNLLQVCEKIPTLGTQLRVLSTVKATMMGQNMDTEEDVEAMDMLVFNAQKLNEAVKETVRAAESASIRVRSDAGFKLKWIRKPTWFA